MVALATKEILATSSIFCSPENVMVFGDNVFVNFEMCSSINFSMVR